MASENASSATARRNRMIAIVAGAITVTAIVVAFAAEYFDLPWKWLRPGVELLLLAELVGLVVLERHQLFEPVNYKVDNIQADVSALRTELSLLGQRLDTSGQMTFYANPSQTVGAVVRAMREALAREQEAPQILRIARLARTSYFAGDQELAAEFRELANATLAFGLVPGILPDSKVRLWSLRVIVTVTSLEHFDHWRADVLPTYWGQKPLNFELKVLVRMRSRPEAVLTPNLVTDRDVVIALDDDNASYRWGFVFQGRQYVTIFARWFDELWAGIPDSYLVGSRGGLNQQALDRIRKEFEEGEASRNRRTA